jgi:hypothetical protein
VLAVWLACTVSAHVFVARYGSTVPFMDDMELVYALVPGTELDWSWFWSPANEHRIPIPRALYLAGLWTLHDFRWGMFFQVYAQSALALALIFAARRLRGRASLSDAFFPLLLLHWGNAFNFLLGMQITIAVPTALVGLFVARALRDPGPPSARTGLFLSVCAFLLPLNGGFGLMQLPPLLLWLALSAASLARDPRTRRSALVHGAGALAVAALAAWYLVDLALPPASTRTYALGPIVRAATQFLSLNVGPVAEHRFVPAALVVGAFAAFAAACALRAWREREQRWRVGAVLAGLGAAVCIGLAIGASRSNTGWSAGLVNRYAILPTPFWITAYLALCVFGPPRWASAARGAAALLLLCLVPFDVDYGKRKGAAHLGSANQLVTSVRAGFPYDVVVAQNWSAFYPTPEGFGARLLQLRAAGYPPFEHLPPGTAWPEADRWFMFTPRPSSVQAPDGAQPRRVFDENAFVARADNQVVLVPPADARELRARYGMLPNAWKAGSTDDERTDGVRFQVEARFGPADAREARVLFERVLRPHERPEDRGLQTLELALPAEAGVELLLTMRNVSGARREYDWGFWSSVEAR